MTVTIGIIDRRCYVERTRNISTQIGEKSR
jgi:hypothetical protein